MYNTVKIFYEELVEAGIIKATEITEPNLKGGEQCGQIYNIRNQEIPRVQTIFNGY